MNNKKIVNYLGLLIRRGELDQVEKMLKRFFDEAKEEELASQLTLLSFQSSKLAEHTRMGTQSEEQLTLTRNKLVAALIGLKEEIAALDEVELEWEELGVPDHSEPHEIVQDYQKRLQGSRFIFPGIPNSDSEDSQPDFSDVLEAFGMSTTQQPNALFYLDTSYWVGRKSGILLTDKMLRAREITRKPKEMLLEEIDLDKLLLVKRWGPFEDLMINEKRFFRFDSLVSHDEAVIVKELLHEVARVSE